MDYRKTLGLFAVPAYVVSLALLVAVLVFGSTVFGGRRWLWFFQPSEVAKLCVVALVAEVFGAAEGRIAAFKDSFRGFLVAANMVGLPCVLILAEPDLNAMEAPEPDGEPEGDTIERGAFNRDDFEEAEADDGDDFFDDGEDGDEDDFFDDGEDDFFDDEDADESNDAMASGRLSYGI